MERRKRIEALHAALADRILLLDGAMGTMIQGRGLGEDDYRGERFKDWQSDLKGNNDLLSLTRPHVIQDIHRQFLDAGADIIETNTFNSNAPSMADYGMESLVAELNTTAAHIARDAADNFAATIGAPRFVAGVLGPANRTASISPDVNDPGYRSITFAELADTYQVAATALIEGGVDFLLVETIFDTLNAKAAIFAIKRSFATLDLEIPVMISGTITDASGRTLSGQTTEAFWNSIRHVNPFMVGLNCALGADDLRPYVAELSRISDTNVSAHPNAGLPNEFGEYDETPEYMAQVVGEFVDSGDEVAEVLDNDPLTVVIQVPQQALSRIETGQIAEVQFITGDERTGVVGFGDRIVDLDKIPDFFSILITHLFVERFDVAVIITL